MHEAQALRDQCFGDFCTSSFLLPIKTVNNAIFKFKETVFFSKIIFQRIESF